MQADVGADAWWEVARLGSYPQAVGLKTALEVAFAERFGLRVELLDCSNSVYPMLSMQRIMVCVAREDEEARMEILNFVEQWRRE